MQSDYRPEPPTDADERATLVGVLERQRATLAWKCAGLSGEQLAERAVPPSELSLLGLLGHAADVERSWFQRVLQGAAEPAIWEARPEPPDDVDTRVDAAAALARWHAECARSRAFVEAAPTLDIAVEHGGEWFSLRYVLTHMIEEYARHNGHADLLRERLDGSTGE
jgi:uncharacterized damage-inducible protein DinB